MVFVFWKKKLKIIKKRHEKNEKSLKKLHISKTKMIWAVILEGQNCNPWVYPDITPL